MQTSVSFGTTLNTPIDRFDYVVIPAGTIFMISQGDYDGYHVHGIFRALREVREENYAEWQPSRSWGFTEALVTHLIQDGAIEYLGNFEVAINPSYKTQRMSWANVSDIENAEWKSDVDTA